MCASALLSGAEEKCGEYFTSKDNSTKRKNITSFDETSLVTCQICKENFKAPEDLQNHTCNRISYKVDEGFLKCTLCPQTFMKQSNLERHLKDHSRNICNLCQVQFTTRKELCEHLKVEHNISEPEKVYVCSLCKKNFKQKSALVKHTKIHYSSKQCLQCGSVFENEESYLKHVKKHDKNKQLQCQICCKIFVNIQQYNRHISTHDKHECRFCSLSFPSVKLLKEHKLSYHYSAVTKKYQCNICDKLFNRPIHLIVHQRSHTGEKPVKCLDCNKNYYSSESLAKHLKSIGHLKAVSIKKGVELRIEKKFGCNKCDAKFYQLQSLQRHMDFSHSTRNLLKCSQCDYSTKIRVNFKRHSEIHTGLKHFICQLCTRAFRTRVTLKDHLAFVHSDERKYSCDRCNKNFKTNRDLKRHKNVHNDIKPYKCSCMLSYKRLSHLKRHLETSGHQIDILKVVTEAEGINQESVYSPYLQDSLVSSLEEIQYDSCDDPVSCLQPNNSANCADVSEEYLESQKEKTVSSIIPTKNIKHTFNPDDTQNKCSSSELSENVYSLSSILTQPDLVLNDLNSSNSKLSTTVEQTTVTLRNDVSSETVNIPQLREILEAPMFEQAMMTLTNEELTKPVSEHSEGTLNNETLDSLINSSMTDFIQLPCTSFTGAKDSSEAFKLSASEAEHAIFDSESKSLNSKSVDIQNNDYSISSLTDLLNTINDDLTSVSNLLSECNTNNASSDKANSVSETAFDSQISCDSLSNFMLLSDQNESPEQLSENISDLLVSSLYDNDPVFDTDNYFQFLSSKNDFCDTKSDKLDIRIDANLNSTVCDAIYNSLTSLPVTEDNLLMTNQQTNCSTDSSVFNVLDSFL